MSISLVFEDVVEIVTLNNSLFLKIDLTTVGVCFQLFLLKPSTINTFILLCSDLHKEDISIIEKKKYVFNKNVLGIVSGVYNIQS
jgi:hypothetical protein